MSSTTCPNCGKPLRPGAKFCGNCGAILPVGAAARPPDAVVPAAPDNAACPHCGKPVRVGARFCANCGQAIGSDEFPTLVESPVVKETIAPAANAVRTEEAASPSQPHRADAATPAPAVPAEKGPPAPAPARPARRGGLAVALILLLLVGCGLLLGGGYILSDRMGWISLGNEPTQTSLVSTEATPTTTAAAATATLSPTMTLTAIPVILPTVSPITSVTVTQTAVITGGVGTPTATLALAAVPEITSTAAITGAISLEPQLLFEDTFDTALSDNWLAWGDNRPRIDRGPGDRWLYLTAEDPGEAGVTSRTGWQVYNAPGTTLEFEGALDTSYARSVMLFDWDPDKTKRGPEYTEPGLVRLEIRGDQVALLTPLTQERCDVSIDAFEKHTYLLKFNEGQGVALFVDGNPTPCNIPFLGLAPVPGAISFSGMGWVTRVEVMQAPLQ